MKFVLYILTLLLLSCAFLTSQARPQYKDIDYRLFEDEPDDSGVIIDRILDPPKQRHQAHKKHHKTEHKKMMIKTNRLERLRRYLNRF